MTQFNYEAQLEAAQTAADGLKRRLEERILGQTFPPWEASRGRRYYSEFSFGEAEAIEVVPPGRERRNEGLITRWCSWRVKMREIGQTEGRSYSLGIDPFLPVYEIEAMFKEAFKGIDGDALKTEYYKRNPPF